MRFRRVLLLLALAAPLAAVPMGAPPAAAQAADLPAAQAAYDAGRYGEAIRLLTDLLVRTPDDAAARLLRAQAYEARRQYAEAAADYERVLALRPGDAEAEVGLERARAAAPEGASPLEVIRRQLEGAPENLLYRLQYAEALMNAERFREAAEQYEHYLARTQGSPDVATRYLVALAALGRGDQGASTAERFLRLYPGNDDLLMRLGYFRLWQGDRAGARQAFEQALALNPDNRDAAMGLAGLDQAGNAVAALQRDLEANPDQPAKRYDLAELLLEAGRYEEARRALDPLRATETGRPGFDRLYARAQRGRRPPPASRLDQLRTAVRRSPDRLDLRYDLIDELIDTERFAEAFDQLAQIDDERGSAAWTLRFEEVDAGLGASDAVYAIDRYTYRLEVDPADLATRYALAQALIEAGRYEEADLVVAQAEPYVVDPAAHEAQGFQLQAQQIAAAEQRIAELEAALAEAPEDEDRLQRALLRPYFVLLRNGALADPAPALGLYRQVLDRAPDDVDVRVGYVRFLTAAGQAAMALEEARALYALAPTDPQAAATYAYAVAQAGVDEPEAPRALERALAEHPESATLLLAAATYFTAQADVARAQLYLRRAEASGAPASEVALRWTALEARERQRALDDARALYRAGDYQRAATAYGSYFVTAGERPREAVREQAAAFVNAGDYVSAIAALEALQREAYGDDEQVLLARYRFDAGDYEGAAEAARIAIARRPDRVDARLLRGDALREAKRFEEAQVAYAGAAQLDVSARPVVADRLALLDRIQGVGGFANPGRFALLVVPSAEVVAAGGDGAEYRRTAQGLQAQFSLPGVELPVVLTAGLTTLQFRGTRLVPPRPSAPTIYTYRASVLRAGAVLDLGPRPRGARFGEGYTRRLTAEAGALTYTGFERTAAFVDVRAHYQAPGTLKLSAGYRSHEGAVDLWAAGAPEFESRFSRVDLGGEAALADSLVRASGQAALVRVSDIDPRFPASGRRVLAGASLEGQAGIRLLRTPGGGVWVGPRYYRLSYDEARPYFFSPSDEAYRHLEGFVEWERNPLGGAYLRALGALGTVAPASGFLTTRLEADAIVRLGRTVGLGLHARLSNSAHVLDAEDGRYTSVLLGAALYVAL